MRNRFILAVAVCFVAGLCVTGCVTPPNENPEAERAAAKQSVQKANAAADESKKRVDEGNAVLDGK